MGRTKNLATLTEIKTTNTETGEITEQKQSQQFKAEAEPSYIKLYLEDIAYFHRLPKGMPNFIYELLPLANYQHQIVINKFIKEGIADKLDVSLGYIDNSLSKLVKEDILIRVGRGTFELNSYLFGKGSWKDIIKHRKDLKLEVFYAYQDEGKKAKREVKTSTVNDAVNNIATELQKRAKR